MYINPNNSPELVRYIQRDYQRAAERHRRRTAAVKSVANHSPGRIIRMLGPLTAFSASALVLAQLMG